jgi:homopolymeric O-antigen transport system permease protein
VTGAQLRDRVVVIRPTSGWSGLNLRELWAYRDLFFFLVLRDVKVRYKQTAIGVGWAILQPAASMVVFALAFGRLAHIPSNGIPYPLFAYAGLLPWSFFSHALTTASTSLVANEKMITKVYFPRMLVPLAAVVAGLLDLVIASSLLIVLLLAYRIDLTLRVLLIPVFLVLLVVTAIGVSLWLCALDVKYRDVRHTLPFLTQIWLFASPVVYPASLLPPQWRAVYGLNPLSGVLEGIRWALFNVGPFPSTLILVATMTAGVITATGILYFRRMERTLADVI